MELVYWPPEVKWELPSLDIASLHLLAHVKFCGGDIQLTPVSKSLFRKKGRVVPCFRTLEEKLLSKPSQIISYLKEQNCDPDALLKDDNVKVDIFPLISLIEEKLYPAVIASLWMDDSNYTEVMRSVYAKNCRYPLNFTFPKTLRDTLENNVRVMTSSDCEEHIIKKLVEDALPIVRLFSELLADKDFLLGEKPSSLDALFFSCIAPLLKIPMLNSILKNYAKKTSNLSHYVNRILQRYFQANKVDEDEQKVCVSKEDGDHQHEWLFPVCVAAIAMFSYAANVGLLQATK